MALRSVNFIQSHLKPLPKIVQWFDSDAQTEQPTRDTVPFHLVQFVIMCEDCEGAAQGEVGSQVGAFAHSKAIKHSGCRVLRIPQYHGQQTTVPTVRSPQRLVVGIRSEGGMKD